MILRIGSRSILVRAMIRGVDDIEDDGTDLECDGYYHDAANEICVAADTSPMLQAETLIHEIIHGIWAARGMKAKETEESTCTHLGEALANVIRDNPDLLMTIGLAVTEGIPVFKGD